MTRVLVACEESQEVTKQFRLLGVEAYSCDLIEFSGGHPEWHIQKDVLEVIDLEWDAIIAFPPCTHLCSSGARWFKEKIKDGRQKEGIGFFMKFTELKCERVSIENPIGIMSTVYRKPDQIIHPYYFGDPVSKSTCLWLKGLPKLIPTSTVKPENIKDFHKETFNLNRKVRSKVRSKTFPGIAKAMAEQWSKVI
jgi:hypothetical protein